MTQVGCLRACSGVMEANWSSGRLAEGAAGGGEPDGFHFGVRADAQALVDGVVFAVDGQDGHVALAGGGGEDFAGGDHALLVGEADGLAGEDGGVRGFETGDADDGGDDEVGFGRAWRRRRCRRSHGRSSTPGMPASRRRRGKLGGKFFGGEGDDLRAPANGLREGLVDVAAGGEGGDGIALGELLDDGEGALADGAGGTEDGESFQSGLEPARWPEKVDIPSE